MAFHESRTTSSISNSNGPWSNSHDADKYAEAAARFGFADDHEPAGARRTGGKSAKKPPTARTDSVVQQLAAGGDSLDDRFEISYHPARYEAVWLKDSLRPFAERAILKDVLALVKGGKEANVYLCESEPATGHGLIAAKVYRPRQFRNLRNDKMYREGRELLDSRGMPIKDRDSRPMRAIKNKSAFGQQLIHGSWLMHEYFTLENLSKLGLPVPKPISAGENALLMHYVGNRHQPAPLLHAVALETREAQPLFDEVMHCVETMLAHGMIHGDLSAYNILYWQGRITLIDFPQVTFAESNSKAYPILRRDVQRVCDYFAQQGVQADPAAITDRLWLKHVRLPIP